MAPDTFILNPIFITNVVKKLLVELNIKQKTTSCLIKYSRPWKNDAPIYFKDFWNFLLANIIIYVWFHEYFYVYDKVCYVSHKL